MRIGVFALRASRQHGGGTANQLLDAADIFDRLRRQLGPRARPRGRFPPARNGLVDRFDLRLSVLARRKIIDLAAIQPITGADFDFIEAVEDVELGESETVDAGWCARS